MLNPLRQLIRRQVVGSRDRAVFRRRRDGLQRLIVEIEDRVRRFGADNGATVSRALDDEAPPIEISVLRETPPWANEKMVSCSIPGMITDEERRYYQYLGRSYRGVGEVVELGPWLGCSTHYILDGLRDQPGFAGRKLWVYDDFVWRKSFMDNYVEPEEQLPDAADFLPLFEKYTAELAPLIASFKVVIAPEAYNDGLPALDWADRPVEIIYVDCGRTFTANQAWWNRFAPSFIPGVTLIVMQDWRLHRQVPVKWFNQTRQFTEAKGDALQQVHELSDGGVATFLFKGGDIPSYA